MAEPPELTDLRETLALCEQALQYQFRDQELLLRCLTHASVARCRLESNERLEFLGDSIMGAVICHQLFSMYPDKTEGELTRVKSVVVSRTTCAKLSADLGLDRFLQLGKGLADHEAIPLSIMAAVFESLVAGVYLDGGFDPVSELVRRLMIPEIERTVETSHGKNYKSLLQQLAQKSCQGMPVYQLLDEKGPDHSKCFKIAVGIGVDSFAPAWGPNKKEAEQRAAQNAWCQIQGQEAPNAGAEEG
jgi:ribonuclease-3